ncbi:acyl carrier protein [Thermodesulfobacteriota bacterium]
MIRDEIKRLTNEVFEEFFEIEKDQLVPEAHIFEDLGLDSLDVVDLVVALQQKFGVRIREDERIRLIRTLNDLYDFILTLKAEGVASGKG